MMTDRVKQYVPLAMAAFMAIIFLDSLRYKFTDHPNTQEIFGRLNDWAASLGADGLFAHTGLFSQYVIGTAELVASVLLIIGFLPRFHHLQAIGAAMGIAIMAGAVSFHLFTPLTIDPNNDGAGLFIAACTNLVFGLLMVGLFRREEFVDFLSGLSNLFKPKPST
ncbi:MAG: DoxX family membrane protein [Pseudomonadota bacterium]